MSAEDLAVTQSLNMLSAYSGPLFAAARDGYDQRGRGSLFVAFANVDAIEDEECVDFHYLSRDVLSKLDLSLGKLLPFVDLYNPDTHFVALVTVSLSTRAGKDNGIILCEMISRDMPNSGEDGQVLRCHTATVKCSAEVF